MRIATIAQVEPAMRSLVYVDDPRVGETAARATPAARFGTIIDVPRSRPAQSPSAVAIHRRLAALGDARRAAVLQRFFKTGPGEYGEGDRFLGLTVPVLRRLAREYDTLPRRSVVALLRSPWHEARQLALFILVRQHARAAAAGRAEIARLYLAHTACINNWDLVDCSAEHIVGPHARDHDGRLLDRLARSPVVWERRIAIVATFGFIKRGDVPDTLRIARQLLDDPHDLIHKAVGWMLREVGKRDPTAARAFLDAHAAHMPRTMLRYAIERLPPATRRRYLGMKRTSGGRRM
jgi:3-methyladenine DNA glycosylase AlkD